MTDSHSCARFLTPADWGGIRLVVFDVDGTLYRQRPLRLRMARDLLFHSLSKRDLTVINVLSNYRRIREQLANDEATDFEPALIAETAIATAHTSSTVRAIVTEWLEQRPLPYLAGCRYPNLSELFAGLRRNGKSIGILSDYPVKAKLTTLGLAADHVVTAGDAGVQLLKPHPRGLQSLMTAAGVNANATVLIGDRTDRDGVAAQRAGAHALIRSSRPLDGWQTFASFDDVLFAPFLEN
jgi:FMN phosphatase YigB (HAD superfamily)